MLDMSCHRAIPAQTAPRAILSNLAGTRMPHATRIAAEGSRDWDDLAARARIVQCRGRQVSEQRYEHTVVVAILETIGGGVRINCGEDDHVSRPPRSAHISLVPAGTRFSIDAQGVSLFREVVIELTPRLASTIAGRISSAISADPKMMLVDRDVLHVAELIAADCLSAHPDDRDYGEGLSIVFLKALSRLTEPAPGRFTQGGLAPWQLRRIMEFLESNIADGARIDALARLANLSSSYFIRAFKVSTGVTPQRWLRTARIRRAQELLVDDDISLVNIAQATGFADQAHLTRIFRQTTGESPGAWRKRVRVGPVQ